MLDRIKAAAPGICDLTQIGRSLKCVVFSGQLGGRSVVAKVLDHRDPLWRWYFEREALVVPHLAAAPELVANDQENGVLVFASAVGKPLARGRRLGREIDSRIIDAALAASDSCAGVELPVEPPPEAVRAAMRSRLLEDPTAGIDWFVAGIDRCAGLGLVDSELAERMRAALADYPELRCQHGDLLPRNIATCGDEILVFDWECAGDHARDWDRALLWAGLAPYNRAHIERSLANAEPERIAGFRALCAFALAREVKFARRGSPSRSRLERDLDAALARL